VIWCGSKNKYNNKKCLQEIGLRTQNTIIIINFLINMIGRPTCPFNEHENEEDVHMNSKIHEDSDYNLALDSPPSPTNHMFHVLGEVGLVETK
jgi:hypothetical protein